MVRIGIRWLKLGTREVSVKHKGEGRMNTSHLQGGVTRPCCLRFQSKLKSPEPWGFLTGQVGDNRGSPLSPELQAQESTDRQCLSCEEAVQ